MSLMIHACGHREGGFPESPVIPTEIIAEDGYLATTFTRYLAVKKPDIMKEKGTDKLTPGHGPELHKGRSIGQKYLTGLHFVASIV